MVITEPVPLLVQRHQKYLVSLQVTQDFRAVVGIAYGVAQFTAKAFLRSGFIEECLDFRRQAINHFFQQIVAYQAFAAVQALRQGALIPRFGGRQQPETQAGDPAFTAPDQIIQRLAAQRTAVAIQHRQGFGVGQAQVLLMQLQQVPRQTQARQVPVGALATGNQHQQAIGQMIEEKLQTAIKHRALGQW